MRRSSAAVRNASTEIYIVFKLWLAPPINPWDGPHIRRLIITHVAVPLAFRRRGILSRTIDELTDLLQPDEIEIDQILSDQMRDYALTRGYTLVPGNEAVGGSFRRTYDADEEPRSGIVRRTQNQGPNMDVSTPTGTSDTHLT